MVAERSRAIGARPDRRNWPFIEFVVFLFVFGLIVEVIDVVALKSGGPGWLWILPGVAALVGLMWLMAREPANL